jgi:hypothetical protein
MKTRNTWSFENGKGRQIEGKDDTQTNKSKKGEFNTS